MEGLRQKCKCNVLAIAIQHNDTKVLESLPNIDFILKDNIDFVVQLEKEHNGNAIAQFILGYCYAEGIVFEHDLSKAVYYYKLAADQNDSSGQNNLGHCYDEGIGIEQDLLKAAYYYKLACDQGSIKAKNSLKKLQNRKEFQDLLLSNYMLLLQEVNELKKENLELRLRPPNIGGPEYEEAKERFNKHKK